MTLCRVKVLLTTLLRRVPLLLAVWLLSVHSAHADLVGPGLKPDLRLLIDISGSMKESDPDNLRGPALELIVRLLPDGAKAGVWIFGEDVKVLVPHRVIDEAWREQARKAVARIDNSGQRTNIPAALAAATYDLGSMDTAYRSSIVLLTDGKVDVAASPMANAAAARKVLGKIAPQLGATGIPVHTIALSDEADWTFLRALAEETAGLAEKAETAGELTEIFVQSLDVVAPTARLPVAGSRFEIDESVEEFTALVFFADDSERIGLVDPAGKHYRPEQPAAGVDWFVTERFALVTVSSPATGSWQLEAPAGARMRVTVIADLQLEVDPLPASMPAGRAGEIGIRLRSEGDVLRDPEVLGLLAIELAIKGPDGKVETIDVSSRYPVPETGEYRVAVPAFEEGGRYELLVRVNGKTLQRELPMYVEIIASPARSAISTRPPELPETSLLVPIASLVGALTLIGLTALWISRRRRRKRLALWQRRFESGDAEDAPVLHGVRANSGDERD
jgi:LPXTG-motif cell wall-anchored protein